MELSAVSGADRTDACLLKATLYTRLRALWAMAWSGLMTAVFTIGLVTAHLVRPHRKTFRWWAKRWGRWIFRGVGVRVEVDRRAKLDPEQTYLFLANHQNSFDVPLMTVVLEQPFGFVAKAELESVPFLGAAIKSSPSVFVNQREPRKSVESLKKAGHEIREGSSVLIFPEGERRFCNRLGEFKRGAFVLGVEAGVPLVPVTIIDGYRVLDEKRWVARPGTIHVVIGEPIPMAGRTRSDIPALMKRVREAMERELHPA